MTEKHFILATAGHVDHGKSALVKALTGTDPDRLPEEKARGITIDLGFAELNLDAPDGEKFHVGIVDVPGHEDFVRNMIAGIGSIDLALLVVAADDGWMPQTEEHLQILTYLGVKRIVVALTKSDLSETCPEQSQRVDVVRTKIREQLKETPFVEAPIIPTSVPTGVGIDNLKSAFASEFSALSAARDIGKPRLFVDRAFKLQGIGTVVSGTLTGGTLRAGGTVSVQPGNISARIRSLQTHGREINLAQAGMRTAINLPDLGLDHIKRGDVIAAAAYGQTSTLDVVLTRSARLQRTPPIKSGTSAYVHHGTTRVLAKIILADTSALGAGDDAIARLRLERPLFVFVGDRLIVRDASEQHTIAGGLIFDLDSKDSRRSKERALLATRAVAPDDIALAVWTEVSAKGIIEPARMLERSGFSAAEVCTALGRLAEHGEIFLSENVGAKMLVWRELRDRATRLVDADHKAHPEHRGLDLNELRASLSTISAQVFDALIVDLCQNDFIRAGSTIARRSHRASLPPELKPAAEKIRAALSAKLFDPPGRTSFSEDPPLQQALRFLIEQEEVIELNSEIVLTREAAEQMRNVVVQTLSENRSATASQLRQKINTTRRVIIPFLEYLDRTGVTQRIGDVRQLRETKSGAVARG